MKGKKCLLALLLAALTAGQMAIPVSVCAGEQEHQEMQQVMQEVNEKNRKLDAPQASLDRFRYRFTNNKPKLTAKDNSVMWKEYDRKKVKKRISAASARKETEWLFRLFRSQYGLYQYYGGDARFEKAQKSILKAIGTRGMISTKKYQKLIHQHLDFITDCHLAVGEELFLADARLFCDETLHYVKSGEHYYKEGNLQNAVVSINGKKPETYLRRAIDENGRLTYYPYAMSGQKGNSCNYAVTYQSGQTERITLKPAFYSYKKHLTRLYGYDKYDNAAYVEMNQAYMKWETPKERKRFLSDTADMKKQKNLVFDLRNNTGGDGSLIDQWFTRYTGEKLQPNYSTLRIRPVWINNEKEIKEMDAFARKTGLKKSGKYYYNQYPGHQYLNNNGKKIFVLISGRTSSAAEAMTDALKNIENVVTIGANTGGVLINMANYSMAMPYSGLLLQFGESLQYFDSSYFKESYGMEPDIYLTGNHQEERLEKFLKAYAIP